MTEVSAPTPIVEIEYIYLRGVVGVFRQCRVCRKWKRLNSYSQGRHKCAACTRRDYMPEIGPYTPTRTLTITDEGRAALRGSGL